MDTEKNLIGVILAAGKGTRASPLSSHSLKPLLPVGNQPIISYQLQELARLGVRQVIIVVGYLKEQIFAFLERTDHFGMQIRCVEQTERLGIAHAVLGLEGQLDRPFILFLGDIFFFADSLSTMIDDFYRRGARGAALAARWETRREHLHRNFIILADDHGNIQRVIEKPRAYTEGLKGCGVYLFDQSIFAAIRHTPRSPQRNEYEITDSIQTLIDNRQSVTCHTVIEWDMNVTFARDILECNQQFLARAGMDNLVAPGVLIPASTSIRQSVIGEGATVGANTLIERSVVFAHSEVPPSAVLRDLILTPHGVWDFAQSLNPPP